MKLHEARVQNFCSWPEITFDFSDLGLALISGATGSGKSSLLDIPLWILWGVTSKGVDANDVRAWGKSEPTVGNLCVSTATGRIHVTRVRGTPAQTDLFWTEESGPPIRGKDIKETQRLLSERIGADSELYLIGAYFNQFSDADRFFVSRPSERREVLERITDVTTAVRLAESTSEARKAAKKELDKLETDKARLEGHIQALEGHLEATCRSCTVWDDQRAKNLRELEAKVATFEDEKTSKLTEAAARLEKLSDTLRDDSEYAEALKEIKKQQASLLGSDAAYSKHLVYVTQLKTQLSMVRDELEQLHQSPDVCPTCNRPGAAGDCQERIADVEKAIEALQFQVEQEEETLAELEAAVRQARELDELNLTVQRERAENKQRQAKFDAELAEAEKLQESTNIYADRLEQAKKMVNPHLAQIDATEDRIVESRSALSDAVKRISDVAHRVTSLSTLYDLSFVLRGELLQNAVAELERETNARLEKYFDGVFRVRFGLEDSDKLTVDITNNGHECTFKSLSGGERRQLVLCFWRALSKRAAEAAGVSFSLVTMDESFNGLSDDLKVKAFRLLEEISGETSTVLVIDHSEALKSMFDSVYTVTKVGEESVLSSVGDSESVAA